MDDRDAAIAEETLHRDPEMLRRVADLVGPGEDADHLRKIAAGIEADGSYTELRPATRVTFRRGPGES